MRTALLDRDARRCVVCNDPLCNHVAMAPCIKTWVRHHVIVAAGWLLGHLPWAREDIGVYW